MDEFVRGEEQYLIEIAEELSTALQKRTEVASVALEVLLGDLKTEHPALTEQIDQIRQSATARIQQMPKVLAALFLLNTREPPKIIEGEIVDAKVAARESDPGADTG